MQSDPRVREVLLRLEPSALDVAPDWEDVAERARRMRRTSGVGRALAFVQARGNLTRGLLIAAAISVIGVGAAGAAHLLTGTGSLFHRHYPVGRHLAQVRYGHGSAPAQLQHAVGTGSPWNLSRWHEDVLPGRGRYLASVRLAHTAYEYYAWPMRHRHGYCVFGPNPKPRLVATQQFCAYETGLPTPWVNRPPPFKYTLHRDKPRVSGAIDSPLVAQVSEPINGFFGDPFSVDRPESVFTVIGMVPEDALSVEIRLQDGASVPASINRPFFFAVIQGPQTRGGQRPVAVTAVGEDGDEVASQRLHPAAFDAEQYALAQALNVVAGLTDDFISSNSAIKTDASAYTYHTDYLTTASRVAKVFGGSPSAYPKIAVVVVFKGPITVAARQPCVNASRHCMLPAGHYAWMALVMPPVIRHLPASFGSGAETLNEYYPRPRRFRHLDQAIRLLKLAPLHGPPPNFAPLGPWKSEVGVFHPEKNALP